MKAVWLILLIVLAGVLSAMSICAPEILTKNNFLTGFINHEILNILAVIMTIAIATISIIHIWFNELEEKHQKKVFGKARREINQSAYWFIWLFLTALVLLIARSLPNFESETAQSFFNGAILLVLLTSVITLIDVMGVVRALTPEED